jgi:regulation of enolase protein 1 (concanavalin A-like superfamily)
MVITAIVCSLSVGLRSATAQTLPSGWTSRDIGTATGGSATSDGSTTTVVGGGANIWGTADAFHFASRAVSGDFTLTARVAAFEPLNEWAKAGVMMRESTAANARNVFMMLSPALGHAFQQRTSVGGTTTRVDGTTSGRTWVRLTRRGTTFTGYASSDGQSWATIGSTTMSLPSTVLVGLGVTSRDTSRTEEATFASVTIAQSTTPDGATATWTNRDIGSPRLAGSWSLSGGTHTVRGAGGDIWDSADQFHFVYQIVTGDVEVIARVASLQNTDSWAKAGVMIRESLAAGARHTSFFATPGNGWSYQYRPVADATSFLTQGPSGQAPGWVRLVRRGGTITAYSSPDGATWAVESTDTVAMSTTVYVGLAVTSHNPDAVTTASFTNVSIAAPSSGGNRAPSVSFSSPSSGAAFTAPATVYVEANAADSDGTIARVDLYQGTTLLKSDTSSPYSFSWQNVAGGSYQLRAVAVDNAGASQTATVDITVRAGSNQLPAVAITSPANNSTFSTGATVTVQASASDGDGSIARVEFYRGTTLIASDTTSPYSATWSSAASGSYALTARAYDNTGASQTSAPVSITVGSTTNQPPTVSITSPASGATFAAPATITVAASASDPDGSIARVDFYEGANLIGSDTSAPYSITSTNVAAGTYSVTAVARDNAGASRTSSPVSIAVGTTTTTRPASVSFTASTNHDTAVTSYVVALYRSIDPVTATPVATRNIGKPTPVSGTITADISTTVNGLPSGSYYSVVTAAGSGGSATSTPSSTFTK